MFGYVRPRMEELKVREEAQYRAAYCGLCHCLGKRYGLIARFSVNYDITFLYLLLSGLEEPGACSKKFCPANPLRKKSCVPVTPAMKYAADICVILCARALADKRRDEPGLKRLPSTLAYWLLTSAYRRAQALHRDFDAYADCRLQELCRLESAQTASMDKAADTFAGILSCCADPMLPGEKRPYQQLLYHIGRFIYLTDALDDLEKDWKNGNYNPLLFRFSCQNGQLSPDDRTYVKESILQSVAMARGALALCELKSNEAIIENITSLGLPAVLCAVDQGVFQAKQKMKAKGEA